MTSWIAFLQKQGGLLTESNEHSPAVIASFGDHDQPHDVAAPGAYLFPLDDRGIVGLSGPDTDKLLQGQLTCDMTTIDPDHGGSGALCSIKGRVISNFAVCRHGDDRTLLITHRFMVQNTLSTLKKYGVFYKTLISDESDHYRVFGLAGAEALAIVRQLTGVEPTATCLHWQGCTFIQSDQQRWCLVVPAADAEELWLKLAALARPAGLPLWQLFCIRDGQGEVYPSTGDEFIPQMLNLQHTGAVSFRKGCYTGQEIVARMQYLGKLKRRMYRLGITADTLPTPGAEIMIPGESQSCGQVVMAAAGDDHQVELLAVLTAEAAAAAALVIAGQPFDIQPLPLPYDDKFPRDMQA